MTILNDLLAKILAVALKIDKWKADLSAIDRRVHTQSIESLVADSNAERGTPTKDSSNK